MAQQHFASALLFFFVLLVTDLEALSLKGLVIEGVTFPVTVKPPGSNNTLFLGGAGYRGLNIQNTFTKVTSIGVYLQGTAVSCLAPKWAGKTKKELANSVKFFQDIFTGPFEKFTRVTMIMPLTGPQYSEKVAENCVAYMKSIGVYTQVEEQAVAMFLDAFKNKNFISGASVLFTQSPSGTLEIGFSKDSSIPTVQGVVIKNKPLSEAVLESIIGQNGVSPKVKRSLAKRLAKLLQKKHY
ncbi:hypothetical protein GIB67_014039 [Kingdonia uniflora]|uniref:Chalcone-flavonone isomerase family protein n=1 Tax=Kingdonia uniflora TaxID=39325 RepID=A0A7J7KX95_9MAGN|nr:hypothetical protein GIB67_014039 [Kingdonia uniflora]